MRKIFFYDRNQFFNLKKQQMSCGGELLSMSQFLSSQKVNELDEDVNYYVDLSSLVGFIRVNDTQTWNFEQLFNNFGENITFICDEVYEEDIKYLLRYVFDEFYRYFPCSSEYAVNGYFKYLFKAWFTDSDCCVESVFLGIRRKNYESGDNVIKGTRFCGGYTESGGIKLSCDH